MARNIFQMALDVVNMPDAIRIIEAVKQFVDVVELGTPLIIAEGLHRLVSIKQHVGDIPIILDLKLMDNAPLVCSFVKQLGFSGIIVQAAAPSATIIAAYQFCQDNNIDIFLDSLGCSDERCVLLLQTLPLCRPIAHVGVDEQASGVKMKSRRQLYKQCYNGRKWGVAGGLTSKSVASYINVSTVDRYIIGQSVIKSVDPHNEAAKIKAALSVNRT